MDDLIRYMSIEKTLDFVVKGEMFFARFDSFDDKTEGHSETQLMDKLALEYDDELIDNRSHMKASNRVKVLFGSCWYKGAEHLSMWDRFRAENGIVVKINEEEFHEKFQYIKDNQIEIGYDEDLENDGLLSHELNLDKVYNQEVVYVLRQDHRKPKLGFVKHENFAHEREYRFV